MHIFSTLSNHCIIVFISSWTWLTNFSYLTYSQLLLYCLSQVCMLYKYNTVFYLDWCNLKKFYIWQLLLKILKYISTGFKINFVEVRMFVSYMNQFRCPWGDCISKNKSIYVGLISTTLSRWLMHLSYTSSIALDLKIHSYPSTEFLPKTIILEQWNHKHRLQILNTLHIRNKCYKIAEGFRFMPLSLVRLRTFQLSTWVS